MPINPKKFVKELEFDFPENSFDSLSISTLESIATESVGEDQPKGYLNNKSLVSFAAGVDGQNRMDLMNSLLLAQLVADKKTGAIHELDESSLSKWYDEFVRVMTGIGWAIEQNQYSSFESTKAIFEMENVIIDIIASSLGGDAVTIITKALNGIKSLSEANNRLIAFEKNTHSLKRGNFQVGVAEEENGTLSIALNGFTLSTDHEIKQILFFKSTKDEIALDFYAMKFTLNTHVYAVIRNDILAKLGSSASKFIAALPGF